MNIPSPKKTVSHFPNSIVDEEWEFLDPTPDIHVLFLQYNDRFFNGKLASVVVKWSPRMTLCAGLCRYEGKRGMCSISLSLPLLKLRPRKDLVETLLHEMIHAFLFLTQNNRDREGHGPEFQFHMHRINRESGTNITIYHSFHEEVRLYKQHWWKCNGPCKDRKPFYGLVKRSMNRAPGPNDTWWSQHQATCGGSFTKIKEPENYGVKKKKEITGSSSQSSQTTQSSQPSSKKPKLNSSSGSQDIRGFFTSPSMSGSKSSTPSSVPPQHSIKGKSLIGSGGTLSKNNGSSTVTIKNPNSNNPGPSRSTDAKPTQGGVVSKPGSNFVAFTGQGHTLGGAKTEKSPQASNIPKLKMIETISLDDSHETLPQEDVAPCPVCQTLVAVSHINQHLDMCLKL